MSRGVRCTLGLAAVLSFAPVCALGQQIPAIETGERIVNARLVNDQLELRDAANNAPICVPRGMKMLTPLPDADIRTTVTMQPQPAGADIIFTYRNMGSQPKALTAMNVGIFTLGQTVTYHDDPKKISAATQVDYNTYVGKAYLYPTWLYSPAWIFNNDQYAVGVSIQYPILEYKHEVRVAFTSPWWQPLVSGEGGRGWYVNFIIGNIGPNSWEQIAHQAFLQPDESRTYVVSVRVTKNTSQWVRTLAPYRNFFRSVYGGVKYQRETTPVRGMGIADENNLSSSNPRGFANEFRPDVRGWAPFINVLQQRMTTFDTSMIWLASGVYYTNRQLNFPCQLGSVWTTSPELATIFDSNVGMPGFVRRTQKNVGFWWGRAANVAYEWDSPDMYALDPDNPALRNLAINELDLAARAGAGTVGLDTFSTEVCPVWKLYPWLSTMRLRYPNMRFVTEPMVCDVLHTLAPSFVSGWNDAERPSTTDGLYLITHPNYLADFLLPGHEIWGAFRYNGYREYFNTEPTSAMVLSDMRRYADLGYRPCMVTIPDTPRDNTIQAAPTWEQTVPADLRISAVPDPFGPVASGSTRVALSTSTKPQRSAASRGGGGGGSGSGGDTNIAASKPQRSASAVAPVTVTRRTVVRGSRPASPTNLVGPEAPGSTGTDAPRYTATFAPRPTSAPVTQGARSSLPTLQAAADALKRWRDQVLPRTAPSPAVATVPTE